MNHPGFDSVVNEIMTRHNPRTGRNYTREEAEAITATVRRRASTSAIRKNPRLKRLPR